MSIENNKRIARNTAILYFRMLFTMAVSLYTSRVVLNTLGVEDFGIYNVVGGIVTMFSFLNNAMSSGTQRFLSFELGRNNFEQLTKIFSMSINIHVTIALIIFILAETVGLWFLNTYLSIPAERMIAANWVYQLSILAFMITVSMVPFNASIIAHEQMNVYAYASIIEVALKLLIVFMLQWFGFDKLKLYAILILGVSLTISAIYIIYCRRNFKECRYQYFWDKTLYKTLMSYAGWNLWGNVAAVSFNEGINILLNIFFGPVVNAARGIAFQVNGAVNGFVSNFQMAMNPQIVKSYAAEDKKYMDQLIFQGSKYSFFLLFLLSLPILLEIDTILLWWLKVVPEHTALFCRLVLINALIDCISGPLITAAQATGKIKKYQTVVGGLLLLNLPVSYIFLKLGYNPEITLYVAISFSFIALLSRIYMLRTMIQLSAKKYMRFVVFRIMNVAGYAIIIPLGLSFYFTNELLRLVITVPTSVIMTLISIYFIGINKEERVFVKNRIFLIFHK